MKRWLGLFTMLFMLAAVGCSNSSVPTFPDDNDNETPTDPDDPDHGLSLSDPGVFWV